MFRHSVKVPRIYKVAAKIAKDVKEGVGSIKQLVYENQRKHPRIKSIYALITTLFQRSDEIESLLKRSQFLIKEPRSDPWLIKVLIVELLWGSKRLAGESMPEKTVRAYEQIFKAHMNDVCLPTDADESSKAKIKPRYVRVNTLSASLSEAVDAFRDEGWNLCKFLDKTNYEGFLSKVASLEENEFLVDIHVPNLLIFPPKTEFYKHPAYKNGSIVLQDKASCLPVHILGPEPGSIVLDMCAAPGMKTTQIAATIKDEGTIYAVENDAKRFGTLNKIVELSGATCVKTINKDVLTCGGGDFPGVQYIIVDPSCTGSGMTQHVKFEQESSQHRVQKLAGFQIKILRSALTRYPDAKRVVYSTCSIFPEENEDVVRQVLETNFTFKLVPAKPFVGDTWKNFGSPDFGDIGKYCLYAKPDEDFTNGFFVAVFERLEEGETNAFFNTRIYNFKKHIQSQETRRNKRQHEFDEKDGKGVLQNQESIVGDANEDANIEAVGGVKRKKKKRETVFSGNSEQAWIESNSNTEDKKHNAKEEMDEIQNKCNQVGTMEDVVKKRKKCKAVEVEEHIVDQTEINKEKSKKKKRKESHSESLENRDERNLEPVENNEKNKESHISYIEHVPESNKVINQNRNDIAVETQAKKIKASTAPHDMGLEITEDSDTIIIRKRKKHLKNKELEATVQNNKVSAVNDSEFATMENHIPKQKKKKRNKESHIEYSEPVAESNEKVNLEKSGIELTAAETQAKRTKISTEQQDSEFEVTGEICIFKKKKKKKHHKHKEFETSDESNDEVSIVINSSEFPGTENRFSKKRKKNKESRVEGTKLLVESNGNISLQENAIKLSTLETQTKKPKRNKERYNNELGLTEETDNVAIKKKKKKHREIEELDSTANGNSELPIPKKKKKHREAQSEFLEVLSWNTDIVNMKKKKTKCSINENVGKTDGSDSLAEIKPQVMRKNKKKVLSLLSLQVILTIKHR